MDTYLELHEIPVLRVKADMKGAGPPAAFHALESALPTLKGRKFYGCFQVKAEGEDYYACVERIETDDPETMRLDTGVIPGGWYVRRKLWEWESKIAQFPELFNEMTKAADVDPSRPSLEFYRSQSELQLLVPVRGPPTKETHAA